MKDNKNYYICQINLLHPKNTLLRSESKSFIFKQIMLEYSENKNQYNIICYFNLRCKNLRSSI